MIPLVSFFSGVGLFELGLLRAGFGPLVAHSETDPFCCAVHRRRFGDVYNMGDILTLKADDIPKLRPVLWCAGFPCQPFSVAGKREGTDDDRNLWPAFFGRAISLVRPQYILLENVPMLASGEQPYLLTILGQLASLGYDATWDVVSAEDLGARHRRRRIWIFCYLPDAGGDGVWDESRWRGWARRSCAGVAGHDGPQGQLANADARRQQVVGFPEPPWVEGTRWGKPDGCSLLRQLTYAKDIDFSGCLDWPAGWGADPAEFVLDGGDGSVERYVADSGGHGSQGEQQAGATAAATRGGREVANADASPGGPQEASGDALRAGVPSVEPGRCHCCGSEHRTDEGSAAPLLGRVVTRCTSRVDRLRAIGNGLVPQIPELIGRLVLSWLKETHG